MSECNTLYDRHHRFAVGFDRGHLTIRPRYSTVVLSCVDSRVGPTHFHALELGDAIVLRNTGGRVTEAVERDLAILWTMASQFANDRAPGLSLAIVHHTDCGLEKLANSELQCAGSQKSGLDLSVLKRLAITDHDKSVKDDIERRRQSTLVPDERVVSAHLDNVNSGRLNQVVAPAP